NLAEEKRIASMVDRWFNSMNRNRARAFHEEAAVGNVEGSRIGSHDWTHDGRLLGPQTAELQSLEHQAGVGLQQRRVSRKVSRIECYYRQETVASADRQCMPGGDGSRDKRPVAAGLDGAACAGALPR